MWLKKDMLNSQFQFFARISYSYCDYGPYLKQWSRSNDLWNFPKSASGKEIYYSQYSVRIQEQ